MKKRFFRVFSIIAVFTVLIVSVCPVAFAAPEYTDVGFIVEPTDVKFSSLEAGVNNSKENFKGSIYTSVPYEVVSSSESMMLWFGDYSFICKAFPSSNPESISVYIGNGSLFSSSGVDTGEPFFLTFKSESDTSCYMVLSKDFAETLFEQNSESFVFAIQPIEQPGLAGSVSAGLHNSVHWVGQVVDAFISPDGAFSGLLPMFAILIAVPALILGVKVIRSLIWGA